MNREARSGAAFGDLAGATDAYGYNLRSEDCCRDKVGYNTGEP